MNFIKSVWKGIWNLAKILFANASQVIAGPIIDIATTPQSPFSAIWNIAGLLARFAFVASFFMVVPAGTMAFSLFYIKALLILTAMYLIGDLYLWATNGFEAMPAEDAVARVNAWFEKRKQSSAGETTTTTAEEDIVTAHVDVADAQPA